MPPCSVTVVQASWVYPFTHGAGIALVPSSGVKRALTEPRRLGEIIVMGAAEMPAGLQWRSPGGAHHPVNRLHALNLHRVLSTVSQYKGEAVAGGRGVQAASWDPQPVPTRGSYPLSPTPASTRRPSHGAPRRRRGEEGRRGQSEQGSQGLRAASRHKRRQGNGVPPTPKSFQKPQSPAEDLTLAPGACASSSRTFVLSAAMRH